MPITAIARDWGVNPSIVRILTTDSLSTIQVTGYLKTQQPVIDALNGGTFQWNDTDYIFIKASDGWGQFTISTGFNSLNLFALAGGGGGGVTPTQVQEIAFNYSVDTGVDGIAYIATLSPAPASLTDGLLVYLLPNNDNTVNDISLTVTGFAPKNVALDATDNAEVAENDIIANTVAIFQYNLAADRFLLLNPQTAMAVAFSVQGGVYDSVADTGAAGVYVADSNYYPGSTFFGFGTRVYLAVANTNIGSSTFQFAGLSALPIQLANGSGLTGNEMQSGSYSLLVLNPAQNAWQLMNPFSSGIIGVTPTQVQQLAFNLSSDTGADGTAYIATLNPSPGFFTIPNGLLVYLVPAHTNTITNPTLSVNGGFGAITSSIALDANGTPISIGNIQLNDNAVFQYNANSDTFVLLNPIGSSSATPAQVQQSAFNYAIAGGTANALTLTLSPAITSYQEPLVIIFQAVNNNTGAAHISVNGLGNINLVTYNIDTHVPLFANALEANNVYQAMFDSNNGVFVVLNPSNSVVQEFISLQTLIYGTDSGVANAYAITVPTIFAPGGNYVDGTKFSFTAENANTASSTFSVNGNSVVPILHNDGTGLTGGEILLHSVYEVTFSIALDGFVLLNPSGGAGGGITPANIQQQAFTYVLATGAGNAITATFSPAVTSLTTGSKFDILIASSNTNNTTLDVGTGTITVVLADGISSACIGGELIAGQIASFEYDGTNFQLLNPSNVVYTNGGRSVYSQGAARTGNDAIAVGLNASVNNSGASFGQNSQAGQNSLAVGNSANANFTSAVAIGSNATTGSNGAVAIGRGSVFAGGIGSYALGDGASISGAHSYGLGFNAASTHDGSFIFGDSNGTPHGDTASDQFVQTFAGGYYYYIGATLAVSIDTTSNLINKAGTADQSYSLQVPSTGFSITIGAGVKTLTLNPSGTLLTGTIVMPASPIDGQEIRVSSSQTVTTLTVSPNSGQTISNAPTTIVAGSGFSYFYNLSGTNWFRLY